jgi:hypothetical protein
MTKVRRGPNCASIGLAHDAFVGVKHITPSGMLFCYPGDESPGRVRDRPLLGMSAHVANLERPMRGRTAGSATHKPISSAPAAQS